MDNTEPNEIIKIDGCTVSVFYETEDTADKRNAVEQLLYGGILNSVA